MKDLLALSKIVKTYRGDNSPAVDSVSFECKQGEVLAIIGGSGSGKTTLLRILAGLEIPERGEISINGKVVNSSNSFTPPEKRDCSLVFQDYALFPNMTVFENVSFGKSASRHPKKIQELLEITGIQELKHRFPHEISGGQQQRVALVRALANSPSLILMDEPLSHLDQELRDSVRFELTNLFKKTGATVIFVSHDTEDAMAMANRIVVLNKGKVEQIGTPMEIYSKPANYYVAHLLGKTNLIPKELIKGDFHYFFDFNLNGEFISIRPHGWKIINKDSSKIYPALLCKVISVHPKGAFQELILEHNELTITVHLPINSSIKIGDDLNIYPESN